MTTAKELGCAWDSSERAEAPLEELVPIAVVIAAGCESCAERMVRRALEGGSSRSLIERTLGIVAHLRSLDCLAEAVGPEVVARMEKPLAAGRRALREAGASAGDRQCCR